MFDLPGILRAKTPLTLARVASGFEPLLAADLARAQRGLTLWIAPDEGAMLTLADAAAFFAPELEVIRFPAWDCLPYDRVGPSLQASAARTAALARLQALPPGQPALIVTTANAVTQRTLTPFRVRQLSARIAPGTRIDRDALATKLAANGYVRVDTVADHGEFAVRGSIIDVYPSGEDAGFRLDFFGDEVETLRRFDPADQRSSGPASELVLLPAAETLLDEASIKRFRTRYRDAFGAGATADPLYQAISDGRRQAGLDHWLPLFEERLATLFDHIDDDCLIIRANGCNGAIQSRMEAIADYCQNRQAVGPKGESSGYRPLAPDALYLAPEEWSQLIAERPIHAATAFDQPAAADVIDMQSAAARDFTPERAAGENIYDALITHYRREQAAGRKVILAAYSHGSRERLAGLLADHGGGAPALCDSWQEALGSASVATVASVVVPMEHGFQTDAVTVICEQDVLGDRLVRRNRRRKSADAFLAELATLAAGDLVVHSDHGIGRYEGIISIPVGQSPHDCVWLTYAGGDKLYVPCENLDVLSRYGGDGEAVALDRLGGEAWQRRRARMKERIREIAGELLATAAERALRTADIATPDAAMAEFVDRFPYQETDDQDNAIADVLADLAAGKPMDRLVCGDVGFGKTEVALRAAFVAAMAGMQVALICPTTLLARQHFTNFSERFRGFPVNVGRLSRLVPTNEAKATREGLEAGTTDIVIGTHALLAKGVAFKRLGLVIVDEEQRFGVTHKERLKALKTDVHVLTLTATPIPRTLQMAMSGLRDLSIIKTPPVDRIAVKTYAMPWDPVVIREALLREHHRGGQSFFVVPRIADLPDIEEFLRKQVPEIRYVVAHGQMAPGDVEDRMSAFYDRQYDVLLSTTIVESGLDIPSANTLIIHRAERFGLAQLYQLRGRVGRSKARAYAYLTTPADRALTETAEKRLKILLDLDTLGAGFQLASHDLDIRGAGNLVGDEQSGHIREVGFELYQSMLEEAILVARAEGAGLKAPDEKFSPLITIDAPIMLPESYIPDLPVRMGLYRRLNELADRQDIDAFAAELIDRFGPLPEETRNLLIIMEIKLNAMTAGIAKLDVGAKGALVTFREERPPNIEGLIAYVQRVGESARLRPDSKLAIQRGWPSAQSRLNGALQLAKGLAKIAG